MVGRDRGANAPFPAAEGKAQSVVMTELPEFDLAGFLPFRMAVAARKLSEGLARRYRKDFGISVAEWRVLVHLAQSGNVSVRDIEGQVMMEKSKVSRAASRLERDGLITKTINAADRRLLHLSLTPKGRDLMARLLPLAMDYQKEIAAYLGATLGGLQAGLDRLLDDGR